MVPTPNGHEGRKTFFEVERVQENKVWLFFGIILLFYVVSLMVFSFALIIFYLFIDPRLTQILFHNLPFALSLLFLLALIFSLIHWQSSLKKGPKTILKCLDAYPPDPEDRYHQIYKNVVEEMAIAFGQKNFRALVFPSSSINSITIASIDGQGYLVMAEGAISKLNRAQLQAFVAQGVARCATGEAKLTTLACSLSGVYETIIEKLNSGSDSLLNLNEVFYSSQSSRNQVAGAIGLAFLEFVVVILHVIFQACNMALSRENGLLADATAVRLTRNPQALAEALYIAYHSWRGGAVKNGIEPLYALPPGKARSFDEPSEDHIFSTHPPIQKRVFLLLDMAHSTRESLEKALEASMRPIPLKTEEEKEEKEEFFVKTDKGWEGPLSLSQVFNIPGLNSETWIGIGSPKNIFPLFSIPKLAQKYQEYGQGKKWECPKCKKSLLLSQKSGLKIHQCPSCRGFLVGEKKVIRIISRKEGSFSTQIPELVAQLPTWQEVQKKNQNQEFTYTCPGCRQRMIRKPYNLVYPIEIDQCNLCKWVWFDEQELEMLQYLVQEEQKKSQSWMV